MEISGSVIRAQWNALQGLTHGSDMATVGFPMVNLFLIHLSNPFLAPVQLLGELVELVAVIGGLVSRVVRVGLGGWMTSSLAGRLVG